MSLKKIYTLAFIKSSNNILLGYKTRGLGKGLWNGFGGKVEENETIEEAARREVKEECNLDVKDLKSIGIVCYDDENVKAVVYVFTATKFDGCIQGSEEMNPVRWYKFGDIPFQNMWPDSPEWYNFVLQDKYFYARFRYTNGEISGRLLKEFGSFESVADFDLKF